METEGTVTEKHHQLNKNQSRILVLLYKFRFLSIPLLQEYLKLKYPSTIWRTLQVLIEQKYVAVFYDKSSFIVQGHKPAYYFLDSKGLALLKKDPELDNGTLNFFYNNKRQSEDVMRHALDVMAAYNALKAAYPEAYVFTRNELGGFDEFPRHKPDLYLRLADGEEYFIVVAHDIPPVFTRRRLLEYVDHSEDEGWPTGTYPELLFVLKTEAHKDRFLEYAEAVLDNAGIPNEELPVAATTMAALTQKPYVPAVWRFVSEEAASGLEE